MYNEIIMERFLNPEYAGLIKNADGTGVAKSEQCGDVVKVYIVVENDKIVDAKFKAFGSPITICASDVLVSKIVGKTLDEALALTNKEIEDEIGLGVSPIKLHASVMAEEVISSAVADYRKKQEKLNKDA